MSITDAGWPSAAARLMSRPSPRRLILRPSFSEYSSTKVRVAGRFRQDLLFRLNTVEVRVPPLRERRQDISQLAMYFLTRYAERYRKPAKTLDPSAMQAMLEYSWPGNVRELDHAVERAVLLSSGDLVLVSDLSLRAPRENTQRMEDLSLEEVESLLIRKAIDRYGGNISQAADALGLSRSALYRRLQKYGIGSS